MQWLRIITAERKNRVRQIQTKLDYKPDVETKTLTFINGKNEEWNNSWSRWHTCGMERWVAKEPAWMIVRQARQWKWSLNTLGDPSKAMNNAEKLKTRVQAWWSGLRWLEIRGDFWQKPWRYDGWFGDYGSKKDRRQKCRAALKTKLEIVWTCAEEG